MNGPRNLHMLVLVFALVLAPQLVSSQVPTLWAKAHAAASENFPISWREVNEEVKKASKQEIEEFVTWTPERSVIRGDDEDIFLFIWARLDDRAEANIRNLDSKKLHWPDTASPCLLELRMTQDHYVLLRFFRSIESNGHPDPFDFGVIRCLGLVPVRYIDQTIAELRRYCHETSPELRKYCDPSSKKPEATGIYGEEMIEIQDMLEYRKKEASPVSPMGQ